MQIYKNETANGEFLVSMVVNYTGLTHGGIIRLRKRYSVRSYKGHTKLNNSWSQVVGNLFLCLQVVPANQGECLLDQLLVSIQS